MARRVHDNALLTQPTAHGRLALLILNVDGLSGPLLDHLWAGAALKVCADGGANRLHDMLAKSGREADFVPDLIVGDLDSLRSDVRGFYEARGTRVEERADQDKHDMEKSLDAVRERAEGATATWTVVALGGFGGRLDQTMANLNMLYTWQGRFQRLLLLSSTSLTFLLDAGTNLVVPNPAAETGTCGLVPLGAPCERVTTSGLKWDLAGAPLKFGGLISSSNQTAAEQVKVDTDAPLLWTSVLRHPFPLPSDNRNASHES